MTVRTIKYSALCLCCLFSLFSCRQEPAFTVEGTIEGAADSTIYLYNRSMNGIVLLDSAKIGSDGRFSISAAAPTKGPDLYVLRIYNQIVNLAIDSTETVTINARMADMAQGYSVEGSESCEKIRQLAIMHSQLQQQVFNVEQNMSMLGQQMADSLLHMLRSYKDRVLQDYIFEGPNTSYAYFALSQTLNHLYWNTTSIFNMGDSLDDMAYRAVATCWKQFYPESERAQQLYNMVEREITNSRKLAARQQRLQQEQIVVADIIDLSLPDLSGRQRTLSELRGKVVLLDFHLFATPESGARILKLRELYNRYHDRGLEIYQVSIDSDEHLWRQAVSQLPWISVYDPDGTSCPRYNVQELPEFFLIDRNNALQKRSSQIDDLDAEIERLLGHT